MVVGCKASAVESAAKTVVPEAFSTNTDTTTIASMQWRNFFTKNLQNLIDTALQNNQELQITLQEIEIAKNEARIRQGFITKVGLRAGSGVEKSGRYTSQGAGDASTQITPGIS
jgi:outer membrane protein TolC